MEEQSNEIDIYDYYKVVVKRKNIIIISVLIGVFAFSLFSYFSPKVYQSESTIRVPMISDTQTMELNNEISLVSSSEKPLVSSSELKLMIENFKRSNPENIVDVELTYITDGLTSDYNLVVQVHDNPKLAVKISNEILNYLKNDEYIKAEINLKNQVLKNKISIVRNTLKEAVRIKSKAQLLMENNYTAVGFNPIELNSKINELYDKKIDLEAKIRGLEGFKFINKPFESSNPVKPKIFSNISLGFVVSLLVGIFLAFTVERGKWSQRETKS